MYGGSTRMHDHVGRGEHEHSMPTYGTIGTELREKHLNTKYRPPLILCHM